MTATARDLRRSARQLSTLLAAVGLAALVGAWLALEGGGNPLAPGFVAGAYGLLAVVALGAAALEFREHPVAERVGFVSAGLAALLTIEAVTQGWWWFAPLLCIGTLLLFLALAYRSAVRDPFYHPDHA